MHGVIREDDPRISTIQDSSLDQGLNIAVDGFDVSTNPARRLTY